MLCRYFDGTHTANISCCNKGFCYNELTYSLFYDTLYSMVFGYSAIVVRSPPPSPPLRNTGGGVLIQKGENMRTKIKNICLELVRGTVMVTIMSVVWALLLFGITAIFS